MDFWGGYADCVREAGVSERHVQWYLRWTEQFARAIRGVPLEQRSISDVTLFLEDLKADEQYAPWQVEQARDAIGILYRGHLGMDPSRMPRTEEAYLGWIRRFIVFHAMQSPEELGADQIRQYLDYLAKDKVVASSTQNQALNAIVFLYSKVLRRDPGDFSDFLRAKAPKRVPQALSREQVGALIEAVDMPYRLVAMLLYGAGLRVMECLQLRVQDLGFDTGTVHVRGKGAKERTTMLPDRTTEPLRAHLDEVRREFNEDRVHDPGLRWPDQYVFPSRGLRVDPRTRKVVRGHMNRDSVQKALMAAARKAEIPFNVTPHALRHAFAAHLLDDGVHIQEIQELLGHARLSTTMIYTHPMNRPQRESES